MADTPGVNGPDTEGIAPVVVWSEEIHPEHHHPAVVHALQHAEALAHMAALLCEGYKAYANSVTEWIPSIPEPVVPILRTIDQWNPQQWVVPESPPVLDGPEADAKTPPKPHPFPKWDPQLARVYQSVRAQAPDYAVHPRGAQIWNGVTELIVTAARLDAKDRQFQLGERAMPMDVPEPLLTDTWTETIRDAQVDLYLQLTNPSTLESPTVAVDNMPIDPDAVNPVVPDDSPLLAEFGIVRPEPSVDTGEAVAAFMEALGMEDEPRWFADEREPVTWEIGRLNAQQAIAWTSADDGTVTWWTDSDGEPATFARTDQALEVLRAAGATGTVAMNEAHEAWVPQPVVHAWIQTQITYAAEKSREAIGDLVTFDPSNPKVAPTAMPPHLAKPSTVIPTVLQAINGQYAIAYQLIPSADYNAAPTVALIPNRDPKMARDGIAPPQKFELAVAQDPGIRHLWAKKHQVVWADHPVQPLEAMPKPVHRLVKDVVQYFQPRPGDPAMPPPVTPTTSPWTAYAHDPEHWALFRTDAAHTVQWAHPHRGAPSSTLEWFTESQARSWYSAHQGPEPVTPIDHIDAVPAMVAAPIAVATRAIPLTPRVPSAPATPNPTLTLSPPRF